MRASKYSKRLLAAAAEDGTAFVLGLALHSHLLPLALIRQAYAIVRERLPISPFNYTDWVLADWPQLYSEELRLCADYLHAGRLHRLPQVVILDNTQRKRPLAGFSIRLQQPGFVVPRAVRAMTEDAFLRLDKALGGWKNEENLRLHDLQGEELVVQRVRYEDYLRTNLVLDVKLPENRQSLRESIHGNHKLESLSNSSLANNLGVNILLFTADGSIVLQKRSKAVAFRRGELCSAASGTMSRFDFSVPITLDRVSLFREGFEELGVFSEDAVEEQLVLLGITRELIRGGHPELFFAARTCLSPLELKRRWKHAKDKYEAKELIFFPFSHESAFDSLDDDPKRARFYRRFDEFIERHGGEASIPLLTNLALWQRWRLTEG